MEFGLWSLDFALCNFEFGLWISVLDSGFAILELELGNRKRRGELGVGSRELGAGNGGGDW